MNFAIWVYQAVPWIKFNTLRLKQNGPHFPDDIFDCIFLNENAWILIKIALKFVTKGSINNSPALVQVMAWRRSSDKPLSVHWWLCLLLACGDIKHFPYVDSMMTSTFSTLLAICKGNSPVTGEFPTQRPVTCSFDVFFDLRLDKQLNKQWWGWWLEIPSCPLWCHYNAKRQILQQMAHSLPTYLATSIPSHTITKNIRPAFRFDWAHKFLFLQKFNSNKDGMHHILPRIVFPIPFQPLRCQPISLWQDLFPTSSWCWGWW